MAARRKRKTTKAVVVRADAINAALDLKREGKSIREIASALGMSVGKAFTLIEEGIRAIPAATRDALVAEVHERQLSLIAAHVPKMRDPESAKVIQASDKLLMSLLGLEAPRRTELTGKDGGPLLTAPIDITKLTDAQIDALSRGDTSVLASPGGDGASAPTAKSSGEPLGD